MLRLSRWKALAVTIRATRRRFDRQNHAGGGRERERERERKRERERERDPNEKLQISTVAYIGGKVKVGHKWTDAKRDRQADKKTDSSISIWGSRCD
jgi:hypothetical protein